MLYRDRPISHDHEKHPANFCLILSCSMEGKVCFSIGLLNVNFDTDRCIELQIHNITQVSTW